MIYIFRQHDPGDTKKIFYFSNFRTPSNKISAYIYTIRCRLPESLLIFPIEDLLREIKNVYQYEFQA